MKQKYLITAQAFGYGPTSKASTIASFLKKIEPASEIDFAGSDISYDLAKSKEPFFDRIVKVENLITLDELMSSMDYDMIISVMDPSSAILGYNHRIKVATVDSLFWFWDWSKFQETYTLDKVMHQFTNVLVSDIGNFLLNMHPHETQLVGHLLANLRFVQTYPGHSENSNCDYFNQLNALEVGPIVDDSYINPNVATDKILVTFGGQKNPLVDINQAVEYCSFVVNLIMDGLHNLSIRGITPIICGNPEILRVVSEKMNDSTLKNIKLAHLKHKEYFEVMNSSIAVMGPASITSFYEANAYGKPYIFLPEQHDGHWPNYARLIESFSSKYKDDNLRDAFPGFMLSESLEDLKGIKEIDVNLIYTLINQFNQNKVGITQLSLYYSSILSKIQEDTYRTDLRLLQKDALGLCLNGYNNGAQTIVEHIIKCS